MPTLKGPTQFKAGTLPLDNLGSVASVTGLSAETVVRGGWNKTILTLNSVALTWTDNAGNGGYSATKLYDFPEGIIKFNAGVLRLTAASWAGGVGTTSSSIVAALGTSAEATGATLDGLMANIVGSFSIGSLTSSAITATAQGVGPNVVADAAVFAPTIRDGSSTAVDLYLNLAADATDSTGNNTVTVSGVIIVEWTNIADF